MSAALGEPDRDLERQMLIARLLWNLERLVLQIAGELRRDSLSVSAVNIETRLIGHIANAKPRSVIVPWHLPESVVLATTRVVAIKLAEKSA
jgi:hypothetical protein